MVKIAHKTFFDMGWEKYLTVLFLLLGIGFFSSGSVTWVAANWDYLSKFQKLYATQGLLGLTTVSAVFFYIKEAKRLPKARLKFISASFFFASAVLIGTLFALIGQIYQTGADPWQLFALWSILQIPLLLILPNIGSVLLLMLTLNVTVVLYGVYHNDFMPEFLIGLNFLLLVIIEFTSDFFHDKHWRVLSKCANLALAFSLMAWIVDEISVSYMGQSVSGFSCLVFGGLIWVYKKYRNDLFPLIVHFIGLIVSLDISILSRDFFDIKKIAT
ncbi:MAG TPA: beta-carotene 15,15'-monooxygenase, partial [Pasteurellaceae bacterium]|nr:beta-carotene 15,15'-monooxygenase [Pasteurellaceae bacterium]